MVYSSGSGVLSKEELKTFYYSIIGYHELEEEELTEMYNSLTAVSL